MSVIVSHFRNGLFKNRLKVWRNTNVANSYPWAWEKGKARITNPTAASFPMVLYQGISMTAATYRVRFKAANLLGGTRYLCIVGFSTFGGTVTTLAAQLLTTTPTTYMLEFTAGSTYTNVGFVISDSATYSKATVLAGAIDVELTNVMLITQGYSLGVVDSPLVIKDDGIQSSTVAIRNPILFDVIQFSDSFNAVADSSGSLRLNGVDDTDYAIGNKIIVSTGIDKEFFTATEVTAKGTGYIVTDLTYSASPASGLILNISTYRNTLIESRIVDAGAAQLSKATSFWGLSPSLVNTLDVAPELRTIHERLYPNVPIDTTKKNLFDFLGVTFRLNVRQVYYTADTRVEGSYSSATGGIFTTVYGKQFSGEEYGANLYAYALKNSFGKGKFLTRRSSLRHYSGFKLPMCFAVDIGQLKEGSNIRLKADYQTINGVFVSQESITINNDEYEYGMNVAPVEFTWPATAAYALVYITNGATTEITEKIRVDRTQLCYPGLLVEWQNSLGGWEQWSFKRRQEIDLMPLNDVEPYEIVEKDIEQSNGGIYKNSIDTSLVVTAYDDYVPSELANWVHEIKTSQCVRIITPTRVINVVPVASASKVRTDQRYSSMTVQLRLSKESNITSEDFNG
jgi:hypothetical protein